MGIGGRKMAVALWEQVPSEGVPYNKNCEMDFTEEEKRGPSPMFSMFRTPTPDGWLVTIANDNGSYARPSLIHVSDPKHEWLTGDLEYRDEDTYNQFVNSR